MNTALALPPQIAHFILIKLDGYDAKGRFMSGYDSAKALLDAGIWPLWQRTRCKNIVGDGDKVLIYIAGTSEHAREVVASATVETVEIWNKQHEAIYPLALDGIPLKVLRLTDIKMESTVNITDKLDQLSFIPENREKWGVALMGGMRQLSSDDFALLCPR